MVTRCEEIDASVGDVLAALERLGLDQRTLVVFTSDNGAGRGWGSNAPLRGWKKTTLEGGMRVPFAARWPGHTARGATSDQLVATMDLMPTFARLAGVDLPKRPHARRPRRVAAPRRRSRRALAARELPLLRRRPARRRAQCAVQAVVRAGGERPRPPRPVLYDLAADVARNDRRGERAPRRRRTPQRGRRRGARRPRRRCRRESTARVRARRVSWSHRGR